MFLQFFFHSSQLKTIPFRLFSPVDNSKRWRKTRLLRILRLSIRAGKLNCEQRRWKLSKQSIVPKDIPRYIDLYFILLSLVSPISKFEKTSTDRHNTRNYFIIRRKRKNVVEDPKRRFCRLSKQAAFLVEERQWTADRNNFMYYLSRIPSLRFFHAVSSPIYY